MRRLILLIAVALGAVWAFFALTRNQSAPSPAKQAILNAQDSRFAKGDPDAPVKIIEYADLLCPYCAKIHNETLPQLQSDYIDNNEVYYELRLVGMLTPDSMRAAEGAYCAAEQGKFWNYIDKAYRDTWNNYYSKNKDPSDIPYFRELQLDAFTRSSGVTDSLEIMEWQQCMKDGTYRSMVEKNEADMKKMEAYGTPHFSINNKDYNGSPPYAVFKTTIEAALREKQAEK